MEKAYPAANVDYLEYKQRVSYFCKRGNFVSNYVISSHTHSVSVLYNFSSATLLLYPDSGISMDEEIVLGDMMWSYNKAEL